MKYLLEAITFLSLFRCAIGDAVNKTKEDDKPGKRPIVQKVNSTGFQVDIGAEIKDGIKKGAKMRSTMISSPVFCVRQSVDDKHYKEGFSAEICVPALMEVCDDSPNGTLMFLTTTNPGGIITKPVVEKLNVTTNITVTQLKSTFKLQGNANFEVAFTVLLPDAPVTVNGSALTTNGFKYGVNIKNYPYICGNNTGKLVLFQVIYSRDKPGKESNKSFAVGSAGNFSYVSTAQTKVAGATSYTQTPVFAMTGAVISDLFDSRPFNEKKSGANYTVIGFRFDTMNAAEISWDPSLVVDEDIVINGLDSNTNNGTSSGDASILSAYFVFTLLPILYPLMLM